MMSASGSWRRTECCHIRVQSLLQAAPVVDLGEPIGEGNSRQLVVQYLHLGLPVPELRLEGLYPEERVDLRLELGKVDRLGDTLKYFNREPSHPPAPLKPTA